MTFLLTFIRTIFELTAIAILAGIIINPYGFWQTGIFKPTQYKDLDVRQYHPLRVSTEPLDYIYLGSSRAREGYFNYIAGGQKIYNAGFSGSTAYELGRMMEIISRHNNPKIVMVGIDFFSFTPGLYLNGIAESTQLGGVPKWLALIQTTLGKESFESNYEATQRNIRNIEIPPRYFFGSYAYNNNRNNQAFPDFKSRFKEGMTTHIENYFSNFNPQEVSIDPKIWESFRKGAESLIDKDTKVIFVINPIHSARLRMIERLGLSDHYNLLMRNIADLTNDLDKKSPGKAEFWDFGSCNLILNENVPLHIQYGKMKYFYDSNHFKPLLGENVIKQVVIPEYYPDYKPIYKGIKVAPAPALLRFSRKWDECRSNVDFMLDEIVEDYKK